MHGSKTPVTDLTSSIGAILVDTGCLSLRDAEKVLRVQREKGMRFGDAAVALGLVTEADVHTALARQMEYPVLTSGDSGISPEVIAAYATGSPVVEVLRGVRSQLILRWFGGEEKRNSLAVVSPERGDGRSAIAANLAVVFSQLGERTLLIDADLRHSRQHELFGLDNRQGLSSMLAGRCGLEALQRIRGLRDLSVLTAGATPSNPQELLARPMFAQLLTQFSQDFDVVILDTPSANDFADFQTIAVRAGGALMVARKNVSRASGLRAASETLSEAGAVLVGSVLTER